MPLRLKNEKKYFHGNPEESSLFLFGSLMYQSTAQINFALMGKNFFFSYSAIFELKTTRQSSCLSTASFTSLPKNSDKKWALFIKKTIFILFTKPQVALVL